MLDILLLNIYAPRYPTLKTLLNNMKFYGGLQCL